MYYKPNYELHITSLGTNRNKITSELDQIWPTLTHFTCTRTIKKAKKRTRGQEQ